MEPTKHLEYGSFKLYSQESLGVGAYGKVCKATYGQLPCAAKLLHDTLFSSNDTGVNSVVQKFEQECQFLSTIKHPNIVQYLGTTRDPQSGRRVLLMELMDESLTSFLDRSSSPLPYHTQLNICFDVALALAYLHFNDIIHRDLSSNNVLMIGDGGRAKVTDLGMSRLIDMNPRMTPMTQVPGTAAYMPPEALITPPHYSNKLDCFSHGVLSIQTITRCFPDPGDAHKKLSSTTFRGFAQIPEAERRKKDIDQIESDHPLLPIALASIKDNDAERLSADDLCEGLRLLRKESKYTSSVKQTREHFVKLQSELKECNLKLQSKEMELEARKQDIIKLKSQREVITSIPQSIIEGTVEAILLKDVQGTKVDRVARSAIMKLITGSATQSPVNVMCGELLLRHTNDDYYNYVLSRDSSVLMFCDDNDIAPLNREEFLLLEAIKRPYNRITAFRRLEWGVGLKIGSAVSVTVPGDNLSVDKRARATVHYKGTIGNLSGIFFGVEITERTYRNPPIGMTEGTFQGRRYFTCQDRCGLFLPFHLMHPIEEVPSQKKIIPSEYTESPQSDWKPKPTYAHASTKGNRSQPSHIDKDSAVDPAPPLFKNGQRVAFYNNKGVKHYGVVGWTGRETKTRKFPYVIVGITTDKQIFINEFEKSEMGISHFLLSAPRRRALFIPEALVEKVPDQGECTLNLSPEELTAQRKAFEKAEKEKISTDDEASIEALVVADQSININMHREVQRTPASQKHEGCEDDDDHMQRQISKHTYEDVEWYDTCSQHPLLHQQLPRVDKHHEVNPRQNEVHDLTYPSNVCADATSAVEGHNLVKGSLIQIPAPDSTHPMQYGTIKWTGLLPRAVGQIAGIELDEVMEGCTDGTFPGTGQKFFSCPPGKGLYYPLRNLQPDERYAPEVATDRNPLKHVSTEEETASASHSVDQYIGDKKGIQGHQNSCYLDATLFGLFALTNEFDAMFLHSSTEFQTIGYILWKNIVNPLRKNGVVKFECVMKLKEQLDKLGITQDEEDPEEFLNMMFKHTLHVEPFISIRRPFGVEKEYFVQLFLKMDDSQKLPTVGDMLKKMFSEQNISFTEVPQKLLIQVPRFGKKFQTFQKVIPAKSINVAENVDLKTRLYCYICGNSASLVCRECRQDFLHIDDVPAFCAKCVKTAHQLKSRQGHKYEYSVEMQNLKTMAEFELLSVICIETSHYVCFTRQENKWIFFDSMASRVYDKYNIPKVVECTKLLDEWVYPEDGDMSRLLNTPPRELPEYVRRLTQDIYMCVYIQPDLSMYG